jgi:outer membrane lipoprotein-sorting protein
MRYFVCALLAAALLAAMSRADDAADARAVVDKAIKASGGADALAKFKAQTFREKGTYYGMGDGLPYTGIYSVEWPNRFRMEIEGIFTMIVAGDKGWVKSDKGVDVMTAEQLAREKNNMHGPYIASLLPLSDKAYTLATLPEAKVGDKPAVGVKVTCKDRPDVSLWFDKATGLLVKVEQMVETDDPKAKTVKQETVLSDHKEFAGCKMATGLVVKRDGKKFVEAVMSDFNPAEKLDEKLFSKPE